MDSVMNGLMSNNGWIIALLIAVIAFLIIKSAKAGLFSYKTEKVKIGTDASRNELEIVRRQIEYAKIAIESFERDIPKLDDDYDEFRAKYILEKLFDEVINWIVQNHINKSSTYIKLKQNIIIKIIKKYTSHDYYTSDEFLEQINNYVYEMIDNLIRLRKEFSN